MYYSVQCPTCLEAAGNPCRTNTGSETGPHSARIKMQLRAEIAQNETLGDVTNERDAYRNLLAELLVGCVTPSGDLNKFSDWFAKYQSRVIEVMDDWASK